MKYTNENGDTVEARGLTLKVELGEKTKNELLERVTTQMQEATEVIDRLTKALADADAENKRLKECVTELESECVMHICKQCGVAYELNIIDKGYGKARYCPNCGRRELYT